MQWMKSRRHKTCWHSWFAWYPVIVFCQEFDCHTTTRTVWLERIERRSICQGWYWQCREFGSRRVD